MQTEQWDLIIEPRNRLFTLNLKDVWRYRDLLMLLVRRDIVSFYKQTILGPLWFFVQPIFTTITFLFVFKNLAGISTDGINPALFYMAGISCWNYFSECLNKTANTFRDNAQIFGKVYFPRLVSPLSIVVSNLFKFILQLVLLLVAMVWFGITEGGFHITYYIVLFPVLIVMMAMLGLGLGMIISSLTTKYRDLSFLLTFGIQLLMYATPVIYPISTVLEKHPKYATLIMANPMSFILETFRLGFLGAGYFSWGYFAYSFGVIVVILFMGIVIFNKVEKTFIDTV